MPETGRTTAKKSTRAGRLCIRTVGLVIAVLAFCYLAAAIYARTPSASRHAAQLLAAYLQSPVSVERLDIAGATFSITGLSIGSPAGFRSRETVACRTISLTPGWRSLLPGRKALGSLTVEGLRVTLEKNAAGEWNYAGLQRRLLSGKGGGGETFIKHLVVKDSSLTVGELRLDNLSLAVTDLSTKGTTKSRLLLTFRDIGGSQVRLEGGARLGAVPSLEIALSAASRSLAPYQEYVRKWPALNLGKGTGTLSLGLNLADGNVTARGKLGIEHAAIDLRQGTVPVTAEIDFAGSYESREDLAVLETFSLRLNKTVALAATGRIQQVRTARRYEATVHLDGTDLGRVFGMLPTGMRGNLALSGRSNAADWSFSGSAAQGITAGKGSLAVRGMEVARGSRVLGKNLAVEAAFARERSGWLVRGNILQGNVADDELLQGLNGRFSLSLSDRMKPLQAGIQSLTARIAGVPAEARLDYQPAAVEPVRVSLGVEKVPVAVVNRYLGKQGTEVTAGTLTLNLQASGTGPQDLRGRLKGGLAGVRGHAGGKEFAVTEGTIDSEFSSLGGQRAAGGRFQCVGALSGGKEVRIDSRFAVGDKGFSLSDGSAGYDRVKLRFAEIRGPVPVSSRAGELVRLPVQLHLSGITARSGDASLSGLAGDLEFDYITGHGTRRLVGNGSLAAAVLAFKEREIGSLAARLKFTEGGIAARFDGKLLEGRLDGMTAFDPFDPRSTADFRATLHGAHGAGLESFGPARPVLKISDGLFDVRLSGSYSRSEGVRLHGEADGTRLALAGKEGKPVLADGAIHAMADLARGNLTVREGTIAVGTGPSLGVKGDVARILSPDREGVLFFSLPVTPLASLLGPFGPLLSPRSSELSASGTLGADGKIRISRGSILVDGEVQLARAAAVMPAHKVRLEEITGTVPFSVALGGDSPLGKNRQKNYPKEPYPLLLSTLRRAATTGQMLRIGRIGVGGMELSDTRVGIRADKGLIEITSLESKYLEGSLFGKGFLRPGGNVEYGAELALHDLSLRALCNLYPKIRGYISGRVDGIVNLYGEGKERSGLMGFVEIWTRSAPGEKMIVSKEFLQKLAGKKLKGIFFSNDRPYDHGEIRGSLESGYLVFHVLDISHTGMFGIKDLNVSVAPVQNKIAIDHLFNSIREAAVRGKAVGGSEAAPSPPVETEFKWED